MKKLALLLLLSVAVYGADSADSKEINSGYNKCVKILKEVVPPLYVNVAHYNIYFATSKALLHEALGLYLNLLIESPKAKS